MIIIYKLTNLITKEIYVGQTNNFNRRMSKYKNLLCKSQKLLYLSIKNVGWNNFKSEIITTCSIDLADKLETHYINIFKSYYKENILGLNMTSTGKASFRGCKHTEKWKQNLSKKNKSINFGKKLSKETIDKIKKNHFCLNKFGADNFKSIPIYKYNINGYFIESFSGFMDASRKCNFNVSSIFQAVKHKRLFKGFYWSKLKLDYYNPKENEKIYQYDLNGKLLKTWSNVKIISDTLNFPKTSLYQCLKRKNCKYKNFIWKNKIK
jgi:group I intron endonuclease